MEAKEADGALTAEGLSQPGIEFWRRPPGWLFHFALVPPTLGLLWSHSVPGFIFDVWLGAIALLGAGVLVWAARSATYLMARRRGRNSGMARWFLVAPAAGIIVLALILVDAPLRPRWAMSRSAFEGVVQEAMKDESFSSTESRRLGSYEVFYVYRQGEAVIFYEDNGAFFDDAGFAYLPNGPFPELENGGFERPKFQHLGGRWYAWTASW